VSRIATTSIATVVAILGLAASGALAASPGGGTYHGKISGGKATVKVKTAKRANFRFLLKTRCGLSRGQMRLKVRGGRFRGRELRRKGASTVVKGRFVAGGEAAKGSLKSSTEGCRTGKRKFRISRTGGAGSAGGGNDSEAPAGHYAGSDAAGNPIAFDVVEGPDGQLVRNLAVDAETECWDDLDGDGQSDTLLARVAGLEGKVVEGEVDVYYAPDEDTEYSVDGPIEAGRATLDVWVGGKFDAGGFPSATGPFECDGWGVTYVATVQR
jgi:hypothetical protein